MTIRTLQTAQPLLRLVPPRLRKAVGDRLFASAHAGRRIAPLRETPAADLPGTPAFGVNVFGMFDRPSGKGEEARAAARALQAAGVPCAQIPFAEEHLFWGRTPAAPDRLPYATNLCHVNAEFVEHFLDAFGRPRFGGRRNIAYWAWELEEFPAAWGPVATYFDEIWAPSRFVAAAIESQTAVPVACIPESIDVRPPQADLRQQFGIPADRPALLCMFDGASFFERKNPLAVVAAFRRAAHVEPAPVLVIKIGRAEFDRRRHAELQQAVAGLDCRIIEGWLDRQSAWGLIAACDGVISLHRSEGFGLVLAEAMALGKPVIATNYSGNTDFMTAENSFPVDYRLVTLPRAIGPYPAGARWAEPDIDHAARQILRVLGDRPAARAIGQQAAADIARGLAPAVVGRRMLDRLSAADRPELATP